MSVTQTKTLLHDCVDYCVAIDIYFGVRGEQRGSGLFCGESKEVSQHYEFMDMFLFPLGRW